MATFMFGTAPKKEKKEGVSPFLLFLAPNDTFKTVTATKDSDARCRESPSA